MAQKRKQISKTVRFEVFKRDKFTCQYCGQAAPNVILEIDHITPVSKGGTNDIMNLVTACRDCNRGKTDKKLDDDSAVVRQKKQLDAMQERREQLEMMMQWRKMLEKEYDASVEAVDDLFKTITKHGLTDSGKGFFKKQIKRFGINEVYIACEIAFDKYYDGTVESVKYLIDKVGGICYNRKKMTEKRENAG